jgi:hypothetical protein
MRKLTFNIGDRVYLHDWGSDTGKKGHISYRHPSTDEVDVKLDDGRLIKTYQYNVDDVETQTA